MCNCVPGEMHRPVGEQCRNQHQHGVAEVHGGWKPIIPFIIISVRVLLFIYCKLVETVSMNPLYVVYIVERHKIGMQLASNAVYQVNIIGVMTGTEIALERMKKVLGN